MFNLPPIHSAPLKVKIAVFFIAATASVVAVCILSFMLAILLFAPWQAVCSMIAFISIFGVILSINVISNWNNKYEKRK